MALPILQSWAEPSDLMRLYGKAAGQWAEHLAEPEVMDWGTVLVNRTLLGVRDANGVRETRVPTGRLAADVVRAAGEHFGRQGARCQFWQAGDAAMARHFTEAGYAADRADVLYRRGAPRGAVMEVQGLMIIPARASYRHAGQLAEARGREVDAGAATQHAEADLAHLDDANVEGILALSGSEAAGRVYILAVGEVGLIEGLFVAERFRGRGIGRTLMSRALEACARSTFRHVFVSTRPGDPAAAMYGKMGFERIGEVVTYVPPAGD